MINWINPEPFESGCPLFTDEFVGCQTLEGLEPAAEVVCIDEVGEVLPQLRVIVIVEALDGGFLDGPVHSLDLAVIQGWRGLVRR